MSYNEAVKEAVKIANKEKMQMVAVHAPIEHAEEESGPYGYCPAMAKDILYRWGTIVYIADPETT